MSHTAYSIYSVNLNLLTLSVLEKFKNFIFEIPIIPQTLKLVSTIFFQICIFHQMIALKKLKNILYFIEKALFVLEIFKVLYFCLLVFSPLLAIALGVDQRKLSKFMMSSTV